MPLPFQRRILHHGPSPDGMPVVLTGRAVLGCWFELLRQGGCGAAEVELADRFEALHEILPGDWMSFEYAPGERWYLGRVEEVHSTLPAGRRLRLEGMGIELNEIFPGGFGDSADGAKPHRYAATDLFTHDPDRSVETADSVANIQELLQLILEQYVVPRSHITIDTQWIDFPSIPGEVASLKFRGEESVRSIIKDLAVRARGAAWGVDAQGKFFFLAPRENVTASYREGLNITSLTEQRTREQIFNRILLTGDYIYDRRLASGDIARRSYRWRANFQQPESRLQYGERRIRLWVPWIRTQEDARTFAREFFRTYSQSSRSYLVETAPQDSLPAPWWGVVRLVDRQGLELARGQVEAIRVRFDHAPTFRLEIGPLDPRQLWPEPPHDERWELPDQLPRNGGDVSVTSDSPGDTGQDSESSEELTLESSVDVTSFASIQSSPQTSDFSSIQSTFDPSSLDSQGSSHTSHWTTTASSGVVPSHTSAELSAIPSSEHDSSSFAGSPSNSIPNSDDWPDSSLAVTSQDHSRPESSAAQTHSGGGVPSDNSFLSPGSEWSSSAVSGATDTESSWETSSSDWGTSSWNTEFTGESSSLGAG